MGRFEEATYENLHITKVGCTCTKVCQGGRRRGEGDILISFNFVFVGFSSHYTDTRVEIEMECNLIQF